MPIYEYECVECGKHFELLQEINKGIPEACPRCGGKVNKVMTKPGAIIFKGSGFYATDYGKKSTGACGGEKEPCDNPKRCCENRGES